MKKSQIVMCSLVGLVGWSLQAKDWYVEAGQKIQDTVAQAQSGDTIYVKPGTYHEAVYIDKDDIKLIGVIEGGKRPLIDGEHKLNDGIIAMSSKLTFENLHIAHYKGNGITTQGSNDVIMRHLIVEDTGIYGIYPTLGDNIVVEDNVTWGIADAGIYIGQCTHVDVRRNDLFANVAGLEAENSEHVLIENNSVYNNSGGILIFALPGLPKKKSLDTIVRNNFVFDNNHRNFAETGAIVGNVPPGGGIVILAADDIKIENNTIRNNSTAGVIIADLTIIPTLQADPEVEPIPDRISIHRNVFMGNGKKSWKDLFSWYHFVAKTIIGGGAPEGSLEDLVPKGADVYIVGETKDSCVSGLSTVTTHLDKSTLRECPDESSEVIVSMAARTDPLKRVEIANAGEKVYATICSGCHASSSILIGPAVTEIRKKYENNPDGIATFAKAPKKVRANFPQMPSQAYLGDEKLLAAAKYMLSMK